MSHLREVVNSLISVCVQGIESAGNLIQGRTLGSGVCQDGLDGTHLSFVLTKTVHNGLHRERVKESCSGRDSLSCDVSKSDCSGCGQEAELLSDCLRGICKSGEVEPRSSRLDVVETLGSVLHLKSLVQLFQGLL